MHIEFNKLVIVLLFFTLITVIGITANLAYNLPWLDSLKFILAIFFLFYIPGNLLLKCARVKHIVSGGRFFLSLGIGSVVVPVIYLFFRRYALPDLITQSFFMVSAVAWMVLAFRNFLTGEVIFQLTRADLVTAVLLLLYTALLLHLSHFTDVRIISDGFMIRNTYLTETIYHQGIVNALRDTWPPPALYASGGPDLSFYHLNMHLQIELVSRLFTISSLNLIYFFMPFLYFILITSITYLFVRQIGGSHLLGIVSSVLIFGTGFSFVPGLMGVANLTFPWTLFLTSTIWPLFTLNGYIPALIALFLCIWFLSEFWKNGGYWNLALVIILAYGAFGFKSTMGLQIASTCMLVGLLMVTTEKDKMDGIALSIASFLMLFMMFIDLALFRSGTGQNVIKLAPFNNFSNSIDKLGLTQVSELFYVPLFILFLIGAFGVRVLGFLYLKNLTWSKGESNWLVPFLVLFVLGGYLLSEMVFVGDPQGMNNAGMNNAGWFFRQSLMGAWFVMFISLVQWEFRWRKCYLVFPLILAIASPSTIQFLYLRYDKNYILFDSDDLIIVDYLADVGPGSVILHPLNRDRPALASNLAGRSSVVNIFRSFISETEQLSERATDVQTFFDLDTHLVDRKAVLRKYEVDYVYGPLELNEYMGQIPELQQIKSTAKWLLYKVKK